VNVAFFYCCAWHIVNYIVKHYGLVTLLENRMAQPGKAKTTKLIEIDVEINIPTMKYIAEMSCVKGPPSVELRATLNSVLPYPPARPLPVIDTYRDTDI